MCIELETKALIGGRKTEMYVYMLLLLASFLFCFPNWEEIEKKMGEKTMN